MPDFNSRTDVGSCDFAIDVVDVELFTKMVCGVFWNKLADFTQNVILDVA